MNSYKTSNDKSAKKNSKYDLSPIILDATTNPTVLLLQSVTHKKYIFILLKSYIIINFYFQVHLVTLCYLGVNFLFLFLFIKWIFFISEHQLFYFLYIASHQLYLLVGLLVHYSFHLPQHLQCTFLVE